MRNEKKIRLRIGIVTGASVDLTGRSSDAIGRIISERRQEEGLQETAARLKAELDMPKAHWIRGPKQLYAAHKAKKSFNNLRPDLN